MKSSLAQLQFPRFCEGPNIMGMPVHFFLILKRVFKIANFKIIRHVGQVRNGFFIFGTKFELYLYEFLTK